MGVVGFGTSVRPSFSYVYYLFSPWFHSPPLLLFSWFPSFTCGSPFHIIVGHSLPHYLLLFHSLNIGFARFYWTLASATLAVLKTNLSYCNNGQHLNFHIPFSLGEYHPFVLNEAYLCRRCMIWKFAQDSTLHQSLSQCRLWCPHVVFFQPEKLAPVFPL